jgi:kynurenine formamidase
MCSPRIMAAVQAEMSRRGILAAAGAAALAGTLGRQGVAARQATPVAGGGAVAFGSFTAVQDLTHVITPEFPMFPGNPGPQIEAIVTVENDGYYGNQVSFWEHTGTHMDAPAHFAAGGATADEIPVERLVVPLAVIDISGRAASDPDAQLTPDDIIAWESANGPLPAGVLVAMHSGWESRVTDPAAYINMDDAGVQHYPGIHPDAAVMLIEERDIAGVGVDTLSIDFGASTDFGTHLTVLPAGKYGLENLANLANVPPAGAMLVVGGPKHLRASGGPSRVMAFY